MYILYMDESGVEEMGAGPSHFVLLGLMIPAELWKSIDQAIEDAKANYDLRGVEIHTAWMCRHYSRVAPEDALDDLAGATRG